MTILALDQSTSATKAILFTADGQVIDKESINHRQTYPQPGWVEHDAEEVYRNTLAAVGSLLARRPEQAAALEFLAITNQRETVLAFERATGRPLGHAIVWQDGRGAPVCQSLVEAGHAPLVQQRTGLKIDTYFSASKLRWMIEHDPALAGKLACGEALAGTIDAYLVYRLTGGRVFASDSTNASRTLLFNIHNLAWDPALCELFHVPPACLPEVRESCAGFGETTFEGLLERPLPIYGVMGDSQAALFAQRCFTPGAAKVTFGTGSSLLLNIGSRPRLSTGGSVTALAWALDGQPTYAFEGITNFTGATIAWLRDRLGLIQTAEESETLARSVPDSGGVYLVPAFAGLSAPYWRADAR
ncbi:MAG: FGGY family carbohydrate kinase, partial [Chloroflexota bacterium]